MRQIGATEKGLKSVDCLGRTIFEKAAVAGQGEGDAVVSGPLGHLPHIASRGYKDGDEAVPQTVEGEAVRRGRRDRRRP